MSQKSTRTAALYLTLVFLAGAVLGFAANQFYNTTVAEARGVEQMSAQQWRQSMIALLRQDLTLSPDQIEEISIIYDEIGERFHRVRDAMEPEFEAIRCERADRIMSVLSADQQVKYEAILAERERRRAEKESDDGH